MNFIVFSTFITFITFFEAYIYRKKYMPEGEEKKSLAYKIKNKMIKTIKVIIIFKKCLFYYGFRVYHFCGTYDK